MRRKFIGILSVLVLLLVLIGGCGHDEVGPVLHVSALATSSGAHNGSTFVNDTSVGSVNWTSPGNAQTSNDSWATASLSGTSATYYLKATGFGFSIPAGATINGIQVDVERNGAATGKIGDNSVRLIKGGTISGNDKSTGAEWPVSDAYQPYGNSTDLWGL
jgi:hypothetical protein